jgi:hypothetical protein
MNAQFDTISVENLNDSVLITKVFIRPDRNIFIVLVTSIIVGSIREGVSMISSPRFVF